MFAVSGSHDQDGRQAHIWYMVNNPSNIFYSGTGRPNFTKRGM